MCPVRTVTHVSGRSAFPERKVEPIAIGGLPDDAPELDLWRRLAAYRELRRKCISKLPAHKAALAKMTFVGAISFLDR